MRDLFFTETHVMELKETLIKIGKMRNLHINPEIIYQVIEDKEIKLTM